CPVAVGSILGGNKLNFCSILWKSRVYCCTTSMGSNCSNLAFLAILSSPSSASFSKCPASVIFRTYLTLYPKCFKYLKIMSKDMKVRQLPKCTLLYTVGPQTYLPTCPSLKGSKISFSPVREL